MSDHFDNSGWQPGMPLPSRKETHGKKKKSKDAKLPSDTRHPQPAEHRVAESRPQAAAGAPAQESAAAMSGVVSDVTQEERDLLWAELEDDGSVLTVWQRLLLFVAVPLVLLGVLVWGKIAYVHQVPDLVRDNVSAYSSGEGFLVIKPWWFGPPVYKLDSYPQANEFQMYQIRMGDHGKLLEEPYVLWTFQQDLLK
jgi:hypothetical protein